MGQAKSKDTLCLNLSGIYYTAQKMKLSTKDFLSKCDQIRRELPIRSHFLKISPMENFVFCTCYPKKKIGKKRKGSCSHHPPQQYSTTMMKTLGVSSIIKFRTQVDIRRNLSPDFVMTKVGRRDCYKSVSSGIVIKGTERFSHFSHSNNSYTQRNF